MEVLSTKHPEARTPTAAILESYPERPPEIVPVDITNDMVTAVAWRLSVGSGPVGTDSIILQHWLLRFLASSRELWLIVGNFTEWLSNGPTPWATYCAMMSGQLIVLDK